jgi:hypothetical protein
MEVKISLRDAPQYAPESRGDTFIVSKVTEREVIGKIAAKFAEGMMESIDLIFDMLIEPGSVDASRISKLRFKQYVLAIADSLKDHEIDILLKTHQLL